MAKKKTVMQHTFNADGTEEHKEIEVFDKTPVDPVAEKYEADNLSAARKRIAARLKLSAGPIIQAVTIDGDEWHVRKAALDEQMVQAIGISRRISEDGKRIALDLTDRGHISQVIAATLQLCCVQGADDVVPLFEDYEEAFALTTDPAQARFAKELFNACLMVNPDIIPNLVEG